MGYAGTGIDPWLERLGASEKQIVLMEVGVFQGDLAKEVLARFPLLRYVGIDPYRYQPSYDADVPIKDDTNDQSRLDNARAMACGVVSEHIHRAKLLVKESLEVCSDFLPNSADIIFIDADHREESVVQDIHAWAPIVKPGGMLTGHDLGIWKSVDAAVSRCAESVCKDWPFEAMGAMWAFTKPEETT